MGSLAFEKYEGLGNDFVVVDATNESIIDGGRAARLCDRRFGIGGDGVLLVLPATNPANAARMKVINADGSVPEMCGNGLRCVAVHVARARGIGSGDLTIETDAGAKRCVIDDSIVTVDMGVVRVDGKHIVDLGAERVEIIAADAGNPHAILLGSFDRARVDAIGPRVATHRDFPRGTNVEFANVADGAIELVVWERGVGVTMACGTGACATVAAAVEAGLVRADSPIEVRLPGGCLQITMDSRTGHASMRGPARRVFSGTTAL